MTTADTIKAITRDHLTHGNGLLLGQCVTAVGWIGGTVPDCEGIVEIPTTDVAGPSFAVGCALMGRRPIFVVRYQGFMWLNASSLVNYAARSKAVWGIAVPIFIRAIGMEGHGIGHTASTSLHSLFMHAPGLPVAAPMTPGEYRAVWDQFIAGDDPMYVSEHRRSFPLTDEMHNRVSRHARITVLAISAARLNALEAVQELEREGIAVDLFHQVWLKPFAPSTELLASLQKTGTGLVVDTGFELCGASQAIAFDLMHRSGVAVHALGIEDRVCGAAPAVENITPSAARIAERIRLLVGGSVSRSRALRTLVPAPPPPRITLADVAASEAMGDRR
jgi:pyruvate/2-oxoglutarate/acetoin dehydrogenase E1 component